MWFVWEGGVVGRCQNSERKRKGRARASKAVSPRRPCRSVAVASAQHVCPSACARQGLPDLPGREHTRRASQAVGLIARLFVLFLFSLFLGLCFLLAAVRPVGNEVAGVQIPVFGAKPKHDICGMVTMSWTVGHGGVGVSDSRPRSPELSMGLSVEQEKKWL